ncbi:lysoplasmalogenase [Spongiivirga citrea]|uniref:Lysoplasmalogenase n=1 Tax=Spongiivirga citrea TaxID=1481457 RepID=A0A6M0CL54_9FLAO|nr:lysoplasmalogenase [Spongiivirga citrea]NER17713.1 hypothetical protein [Spongiivirga citrea]
MKRKWSFIGLFLLILTVDLVFKNYEHLAGYRIVSKPLVIISLLVYYISNSRSLEKDVKNPILVALVLLIIGDFCFLAFENDIFFNLGFVAFMVANFFYFKAFLANTDFNFKLLIPFWILCGVYFFVMLSYLYLSIDLYLMPMMIFFIIMVSMANVALMRYKMVNNSSFYFVFIGTLFYLYSISLIAFDKFDMPVTYQYTLEMASYGLGHLLIVLGMLEEKQTK